MRRRQRRLSKKAKGSGHRNRVRVLVAKTHEIITNQRKDFLHKTANYYIENYKTIYVEDLNIKGTIRNRHLAKSISDCSWGMFFNILCQKAVEAVDREVIKVSPKNTSEICSCCGFQVHKSLSQRVHHCPSCGLKIHRDLNSALIIRGLGQSLQALTSAVAVVA